MGTRKIRTAAGRESALDAATQLLAEREKYEQWLEDLEDKKDSTPAKVFDRVRQDYLARLQSVMEQLEEHTATLQEHAENLMTRLRELEEAEAENNEAQEEAAVRKQVGEMTSAEWESGSRKAQRELAKIKENQTVILADLNRIRDLLGGEEEEEAPPAGKSSKDFNELEFLSSVVGTGSHATPNPPPPAVPAKPTTGPRATPSAAQPPARQTPTGTAAPRSTPTGTPASSAAASAPPAPAAPPPAPAPPPAAAAAPPAPPVEAKPSATETPAAGNPNQPRKSAMAEQPKTLKCQECGTMNLPSEWYCERCGAELTVV